MKLTRLVGPLLSLSIFATAAFAQPPGKIAVMNTYAFSDEKTGIAKLVNAQKSVDAEFKQADDKLKAMQVKLNGLSAEIENYRKLAATTPNAVDGKAAQAKMDEAAGLDRQIKFEVEDTKSKYEKRQEIMIGPVMQDIYKAAQEFTTQKGFLLILDIGKMAEANLVMGLDDKADVTKDFIAFYNARSAAPAAKPAGK